MSQSKIPTLNAKIKGIFYKSDEKKQHHFIFPNVYHNDQTQTHTLNVLSEYDKKIEKHFHGSEQKIDAIIMSHDISVIKSYKPIYHENKLGDSNTQYNIFKCKIDKNLDQNFLVGLEYLLDVNCYAGQFINNENREHITYWSININDSKEVTRL
jgi:hypothetical protein